MSMTEALSKSLRVFTPTALVLALAGCAVGPDFRQPELPVPERFQREDAAKTAAAPSDGDFWKGFNDPQLSSLVERALAANGDLRVALARYDRANALLGQAQWDRFPTATASAQAGRERLSQDQSYGFPRSHRTFSAGIDVSWELDLFGRVRRGVEAQRAGAKPSA